MQRRMPARAALAIPIALALILTACSSGQSTASAPVTAKLASTVTTAPSMERQTSTGPILGNDDSDTTGTYSWLGVPYAKAPVGALRWAPTQPATPWTEVKKTQDFGASCVQGGRFYSPAPDNKYGTAIADNVGKPTGSEDCLTLNISRPAGDAAGLPVIMFIHGGSNISGYSADPIYDGRNLAEKANAVVVTINYRLGMFGWLDLAALKTGEPLNDSGNFAILDQVQALKFIQANAATFGGDKGNVTVMGESAGAGNTWALLLSPLTKGLMNKAMPMSGGLVFSTVAASQKYSNALLAAAVAQDGLAVPPTAVTNTAAYLRGKSADDLIMTELANPTVGAAPAIFSDGAVVPVSANAAIVAGEYRKIPVLAGNMKEEAKLFGGVVYATKPTTAELFRMQYDFDPNAAVPSVKESDIIKEAYLPVDRPGGWNDVTHALTVGVFEAQTAVSMASLATANPSELFEYRMDWNQEPKPFDTVYGAVHAMDLPFAFANFGRSALSFGFSTQNEPGRVALSDAFVGTISAFVRTGNPSTAAVNPEWPTWPTKQILDASDTATSFTTLPAAAQ